SHCRTGILSIGSDHQFPGAGVRVGRNGEYTIPDILLLHINRGSRRVNSAHYLDVIEKDTVEFAIGDRDKRSNNAPANLNGFSGIVIEYGQIAAPCVASAPHSVADARV